MVMTIGSDQLKAEGQRLMLARIKAGYPTALEASKSHKWAQRTYSDHEGGRRGFRHLAAVYAEAFKVTIEELIGPHQSEPAKIPHIDYNRLGEISLDKLIAKSQANFLTNLECGLRCFSLQNPDRSMTTEQSPQFLQGDILVFDPSASILAGDFVLAEIDGFPKPFFRIFYPYRTGGALFKSLNSAVEEMRITKANQWRNLAKFVFLIRPASIIG